MSVASGQFKRFALLLMFVLLPFGCLAMDASVIEINRLANLYQPVAFDHELHVSIAEDCSSCHHHTTGTGPADGYCARCHSDEEGHELVSCQDCHAAEPFVAAAINASSEQDLFHIDVSGLKGAYHQNCIGCHEEMGGPVGCTDCHARTEEGDKFFYSGQFAPAGDAGSSH